MATQKVDISMLLLEAKEIAKAHFSHYLTLLLLFILPFSFAIVAYPTLQYSLATPETKSRFEFPFNGDPIVFKPLALYFLYLFTLLWLSICAVGTVSYSVYHGFFGKPVKFIDTIKSLSNSFMRLFATFFRAHAMILGGLVVISLTVFGVISGIGCLGYKIQYDSICFRAFYVLGWVLLGVGLFYLYVDWLLAPVIVVVELSWGSEPLKRSAYLVKENRDVVARLLLSICGMIYVTVFGYGIWGQIFPIGSSIYGSTTVVVMVSLGSYMLSRHLLHILIAIMILYIKCKALHGKTSQKIKEDINQEYISLPLDEEKVANVI